MYNPAMDTENVQEFIVGEKGYMIKVVPNGATKMFNDIIKDATRINYIQQEAVKEAVRMKDKQDELLGYEEDTPEYISLKSEIDEMAQAAKDWAIFVNDFNDNYPKRVNDIIVRILKANNYDTDGVINYWDECLDNPGKIRIVGKLVRGELNSLRDSKKKDMAKIEK